MRERAVFICRLADGRSRSDDPQAGATCVRRFADEARVRMEAFLRSRGWILQGRCPSPPSGA